MRRKVVIDCSVAVKWFFTKNESLIDQADKLIRQHLNKKIQIVVPELILSELLNVAMISKKSSPEKTGKIVHTFLKSGFEIKSINNGKYLTKSIFYTKKYGASFYDSSYVALAKLNKCQLITDDVKLKNKTKLKFIKLLKDV